MYDACIRAIQKTYGKGLIKKKLIPNPDKLADDALVIVKGGVLDGYWLSCNGYDDTTIVCGITYDSAPPVNCYFVHEYHGIKYNILYDGLNVEEAAQIYLNEVGFIKAIKSVIAVVCDDNNNNIYSA
jgi:hypothetical protein